MILTREDQRAVDAAYYHLRALKFDMTLDKLAKQIDVEEQMYAQWQAKRAKTRREVRLAMASRPTVRRPVKRSTPRYSTKARVETTIIEECYALKKRLPLSVQKRFQAEYDSTPYGAEEQLIAKYSKLYRLQ